MSQAKKMNDCFDQELSPLCDDVIARIDALGVNAFQAVTLGARAIARIAVGLRISVAQAADGGRALTPAEREELMEFLIENQRKSDAALMAAIERKDASIQ
jgi:hypothetical protein